MAKAVQELGHYALRAPSRLRKAVYVDSLKCARLGWFRRRGAPGRVVELYTTQGQQFEDDCVDTIFPGAVQLPEGHLEECAKVTEAALAGAQEGQSFCQPTFVTDTLVARADVVTTAAHGLILTEIKSGTKPEKYVSDLMFTREVMKRAGIPVSAARFVTAAPDWELGHPEAERFVETPSVYCPSPGGAGSFSDSVTEQEERTAAAEPPPRLAVPHCKNCPLSAKCWPEFENKMAVFHVPRPSLRRLQQMQKAAKKSLYLKRVPPRAAAKLLTETQAPHYRAARAGGLVFDQKKLRAALKKIQPFPRTYLDFETVSLVKPLFPHLKPLQNYPFQFSAHVQMEKGAEVVHHEFLGDPAGDCRAELVEALGKLPRSGPVIAYNAGFESRVLLALQRFDLGGAAASLQSRLVDLMHVVLKGGVAHPRMKGSVSLKAVYAAVMGDQLASYGDLDVGTGLEATGAYYQMLVNPGPDDETTRSQLLAYCNLDTLSMVHLHQKLSELCKHI
eukprot:TRINITY_DN3349_c0_g1_i1.p1 TRINITY_DN3349_c0_g1~~TRINITY_DN3349_c0_g1_i1.p1  ORF type:complete len:522 (+),score=116.04 TRINITY_DN3349_c0_g1_i1:55-1566(+)